MAPDRDPPLSGAGEDDERVGSAIDRYLTLRASCGERGSAPAASHGARPQGDGGIREIGHVRMIDPGPAAAPGRVRYAQREPRRPPRPGRQGAGSPPRAPHGRSGGTPRSGSGSSCHPNRGGRGAMPRSAGTPHSRSRHTQDTAPRRQSPAHSHTRRPTAGAPGCRPRRENRRPPRDRRRAARRIAAYAPARTTAATRSSTTSALTAPGANRPPTRERSPGSQILTGRFRSLSRNGCPPSRPTSPVTTIFPSSPRRTPSPPGNSIRTSGISKF